MVYLPTFTIRINKMQVDIPYMVCNYGCRYGKNNSRLAKILSNLARFIYIIYHLLVFLNISYVVYPSSTNKDVDVIQGKMYLDYI